MWVETFKNSFHLFQLKIKTFLRVTFLHLYPRQHLVILYLALSAPSKEDTWNFSYFSYSFYSYLQNWVKRLHNRAQVDISKH